MMTSEDNQKLIEIDTLSDQDIELAYEQLRAWLIELLDE